MDYIKSNRYFAQVAGSLEQLAFSELKELGANTYQVVPRGVYFSCERKTLYRIIYTSRLVQRVLAPIISFDCHSEDYLYQQAFKNVDWTALFSVQDTFSIMSNVSSSNITHSLYAGQKLKDAICDRFREQFKERPNFTLHDADIIFNLHIHSNRATISLDVAGGSLHKRGYRLKSVTAPLQETLAAAIIRMSGWNGETPLIDPMCGSGTILAEALMKICHIPAGYLRPDRAIRFMPDYDDKLWKQVRHEADEQIISLPDNLIHGSDIDSNAIIAAKTNLACLPSGSKVQFVKSRFQEMPSRANCTIITNPPYGIRIGDWTGTRQLYYELGNYLKQKCPQSIAYILCGNGELVSELRLRTRWDKSLKNGDLDTKLVKILLKGTVSG